MNFAERFCAQRALTEQQYEREALRCTLHTPARWILPLLNLNRDYFAADRAFIRDVGRIDRMRDFDNEARDFMLNPANAECFLHRRLKLRVSVRKLRWFALQAFANAPAEKQRSAVN